MSEVTRNDVMDYARSWVEVRWKHQGRTRAGIDCAGLLRVTMAHFDLGDFDILAYSDQPDGHTLDEIIDRELIALKPQEASYGDIVKLADKKWSCHMGILGDKGQPFSLIHAYAQVRKVTENRLDPAIFRVKGYYRFPRVNW